MTLTINDLPAILGDLARLEPTRFRLGTKTWRVRAPNGKEWAVVLEIPLTMPDLALVQAAVQEAITARGWEGSVVFGRYSRRADVWYGNSLEVYAYAKADLPAVALASAYRDALLALQEAAA